MLRKTKRGRSHWEFGLPRGHRRQSLSLADRIGKILAASLRESRLPIEQIHLRWGTGLEQVDDPFGLGGMMLERRWGGVLRRNRRR